ncbi:hypothetical protein PoMZ_05041 [Pyricularia oryzae]|uniref:Uncharacterized protein n=1 Tax=Pyricularia oryzae TaxID=318829 RepID=A0A4P7ND76_PYROR|nr:hypothetical protein PoMZ_05041 [Pyricularia oryzae]
MCPVINTHRLVSALLTNNIHCSRRHPSYPPGDLPTILQTVHSNLYP